MLSVQANTGPRWENKSSLAFFRGRDSRQERLDLVRMSRKHPDVIDAKLTNMFFFKHTEDLGELVKHVSFYDFFEVNCVVEKSIYCLFMARLTIVRGPYKFCPVRACIFCFHRKWYLWVSKRLLV